MATPRVPGDTGAEFTLPCGESARVSAFDLGMREFRCSCGETHAVVTDVHPPSRFVPESIVAVLREAVETADEFGEFGTPHLMGMVIEEFPDEVVAEDTSEEGAAGYSMLWVTGFDSRALHEVVVELIVELMEHAIGHAEDPDAEREFEEGMFAFDVSAFVDEYRRTRDFEDEHDTPV
ncbi:DUF5815 family protein [Natronorarus salvus]|uniref:DUF5815 family protein n=1 Tax=Natronorarus salvus TaxID=3117733 RepID=UPI002F2623EB